MVVVPPSATEAGPYAVNVAVYSTEPYVRPADNPFAPAPKFTLFDEYGEP